MVSIHNEWNKRLDEKHAEANKGFFIRNKGFFFLETKMFLCIINEKEGNQKVSIEITSKKGFVCTITDKKTKPNGFLCFETIQSPYNRYAFKAKPILNNNHNIHIHVVLKLPVTIT